ncbi:MAG: uracil-xanthine permease [Oscillospiraceae bacterium]|nr:uracil-xanthine permease [Oscillospiraceae bacterium]MCL2227832.1 uracil-xanthine permease [Oscillospiraceae bacterium]
MERKLTNPGRAIMGLQHLFAMFGATILVPLISGLSVQVTLFAVGIGTIIFHLISGLRKAPPVFLGSSFAFLVGIGLITNPEIGVFAGADMTQNEKLAYATGGIMIAGFLYLALAGLIKVIGVKTFMKYLPTVVTAPTVILIGVMLAPFAISQSANNLFLAIATLVIIICFSVWGKGMTKIIPILLGIVGAYIIALLMHFALGMTNPDGSAILEFGRAGTGLVGVPPFMAPRFSAVTVLVMLPFALATIAEHIGDMVILKRISGNDYINDPGLVRTLCGDGIATIVGGAMGGPATTTYSENVGVVTITKIFDPRVLQIAAIYAVVLGFSPLFASVIYSIPDAIIGGASFILYGMIASVGIRNLVDDRVNLADMKNCIIVAVMLVIGLGLRFGPAITITIGETNMPLDRLGVAIAVIVGIILNVVLPADKSLQMTGDKPID